VSLSFYGKRPGPGMRMDKLSMQFSQHDTSHAGDVLEAYERLILDAMRGDATLFTRNDEIEALWGIIDPVLTAWHDDTSSPIPEYPAGSEGPPEADALLGDERVWRRL
jgi:glucose-6-phosphate 1-dehydrogenase